MNQDKRTRKAISILIAFLMLFSIITPSGVASYADDAKSDTPESTDLGNFITNVNILGAEVDPNTGEYIVDEFHDYDVELTFAEGNEWQFANESELVYNLPSGMNVQNMGPFTLTIPVIDDGGEYDVPFTWQVVDGKLKVNFDKTHEHFDALNAVANAEFTIKITSKFVENIDEITFSDEIIKDFQFEDITDLDISKAGVYDEATGKINYTLTVSSTGDNTNLKISDVISGTALTLNQDVVVISNKTDPVTVNNLTYNGNAFDFTVPSSVHGEVFTIKYSADVNYDAMPAYPPNSENFNLTGNTAKAKSDESTEKEAKWSTRIISGSLAKNHGTVEDLGNGKAKIPWTIVVNSKFKRKMGGVTVNDSITLPEFQNFDGAGIKVKVTNSNGTVIRDEVIPWADLEPTMDNGKVISWKYKIPDGDGKYKYEITSDTIVDKDLFNGLKTFQNKVEVDGGNVSSSVSVGDLGPNPSMKIKKSVAEFSNEKVKWNITLTDVPGEGIDGEVKITDEFPIIGQILDDPDYTTLNIEGLLDGESYEVTQIASDSPTTPHSMVIKFYQDAAKTMPGLKATADGSKRTITITIETKVNQERFDNNDSTVVKNISTLEYNGFSLPSEAQVRLTKKSFKKNLVESTSTVIDGIKYPVYKYELILEAPTEENITIDDTFETEYLKFYEANGVEVKANNYNQGSSFPYNGGTGDFVANATGGKLNLTLANNGDRLYSRYRVRYSLIVKDEAALNALNLATVPEGGKHKFVNTATWDNLTDDAEALYFFESALTKEQIETPTNANNHFATYKIVINPLGIDLAPGLDTFDGYDELSSNLVLQNSTIKITPDNLGIETGFDPNTNTISFIGIPDEQRVEIEYKVRVIGTGVVNYTNTMKIEGYKQEVTNQTTITTGGSGSASNPSIRIVKYDKDNLTATLPGATFKLFDENGEAVIDKNGQEVTFTTGDNGEILIQGDQTVLGWTIWKNKKYTLKEVTPPEGYVDEGLKVEFTLVDNPKNPNEYSVVGSKLYIANIKEKKDITAKKRWLEAPENKPTIWFQLYRKVKGTDDEPQAVPVAEAPIKKLESGTITVTWKNMATVNKDKQEYEYSVKEVDASGNPFTPEGYEKTEDGLIVTNKNVAKISIDVEKKWHGPEADKQPVKVVLKADGVEEQTVELKEDNDWKHTFKDLPKYKDGKEIVYTIEELTPIDGYTSMVSGNVKDGFIITNKSGEKVEVNVTKKWIGSKREKDVTIKLLADGTEVQTVDLNEANNWQHTFADLAKYGDKGEIEYTVEEEPMAGYDVEYVKTTSGSSINFAVTNENTETVRISIEKVWNGTPANSAKIDLFADGILEITKEFVAPWKVFFGYFAKYNDNGEVVEYTVKEVPIEDYSSQITSTTTIAAINTSGSAITTGTAIDFVVTNTKLYKLGNYVWYDDNKDGIQNEGTDRGVEGVKVTLTKPDGTTEVTYTNASGYYEFKDLPNGEYKVEFSNLPAGYQPTTSNVGTNDLIDSDGLTPTGEIKDADNMSLDLGIYKTNNGGNPGGESTNTSSGTSEPSEPKLYKLGNYVWYDDNHDGVQDPTEHGVAGVKVVLFDKDGNQIAETVTDINGRYIFTGLANGEYSVQFSNLPAGYQVTLTDVGVDTLDSDGLNPTGTIDNADNLTLDLGIYKPAEPVVTPVEPVEPTEPQLPRTNESLPVLPIALGLLLIVAGAGAYVWGKRTESEF